MKTFDVSSRKCKNGKRKFKLVIHEIYPDSCIDTQEQVGTIFNDNGITWIREYVEQALPSIEDMSLRVEFVNEEKTEILGHGETGVQDGLPLFENAEIIGHFTHAYITEIEDEGVIKTVLIGEGYLDEMCHPAFVQKLIHDIKIGEAPFGSVEISKYDEESGIIYKYGYKDEGRIPTGYNYTGYALLGICPADDAAKLLEINAKKNKEEHLMDEKQVKDLVREIIEEVMEAASEIKNNKEECAAQVATKEAVIEELNTKVAGLEQELEACQTEKSNMEKNIELMLAENESLKEKVVEAQKSEKRNALKAAVEKFSDEEKGYAKEEMKAFEENPLEVAVEEIVNAILVGIGKNAKEQENVVSEQNARKANIEDIFSEVSIGDAHVEDDSIF